MISSFGYPVQLIPSARQYLDGPHVDQTACLILDITMPEMDGFELHSLLKTSHRSVPTIFISAHDDATYRERVNSIDSAIFLQKPCEENLLHDAIHNALSG